MPEPDFDQIVSNLWNDGEVCNVPFIEEQLRLLWNARGAADRAALGVEFKRAMGAGGGEIRPEEILKALDS